MLYHQKPASEEGKGTVYSLDLVTGKSSRVCQMLWNRSAGICSPDGRYVADNNGQIAPSTIRVYDLTSGKQVARLDTPANVYMIAFNQACDSLYITRFLDNGTDLLRWKLTDKEPVLVASLGDVMPGTLTVTASEDKIAFIHLLDDGDSGELCIRPVAGDARVLQKVPLSAHCNLTISPSGRYLLYTLIDSGGLLLCDLQTGKSCKMGKGFGDKASGGALYAWGDWHPTEDRFLVVSPVADNAQLREYRAADLIK